MYSIKNLHFAFKRRANKVDSLQQRNFFVEQIDDYLNEALSLFIEEILKLAEVDQNKNEYINQLIKTETLDGVNNNGSFISALPQDYYRHLRSYSSVKDCDAIIQHYPIQYDDLNAFLTDINYKPSLQWRETGMQLKGEEIVVWTNDEFSIDKVHLTYVSKHPRLGNPEDSKNGAYNLPDGTIVSQQDLIIDNKRQFDTVADIAVLLASIDMASPDYQIKLNKILQNYVL